MTDRVGALGSTSTTAGSVAAAMTGLMVFPPGISAGKAGVRKGFLR
jgi:hypothetical protein